MSKWKYTNTQNYSSHTENLMCHQGGLGSLFHCQFYLHRFQGLLEGIEQPQLDWTSLPVSTLSFHTNKIKKSSRKEKLTVMIQLTSSSPSFNNVGFSAIILWIFGTSPLSIDCIRRLRTSQNQKQHGEEKRNHFTFLIQTNQLTCYTYLSLTFLSYYDGTLSIKVGNFVCRTKSQPVQLINSSKISNEFKTSIKSIWKIIKKIWQMWTTCFLTWWISLTHFFISSRNQDFIAKKCDEEWIL